MNQQEEKRVLDIAIAGNRIPRHAASPRLYLIEKFQYLLNVSILLECSMQTNTILKQLFQWVSFNIVFL